MILQNLSDLDNHLRPKVLFGDLLISGDIIRTEVTQTVLSPLTLKAGESLEQPVLGELSLAKESHVLQALTSAKKAWKNGSGEWPSLSRLERLQKGKAFIEKMEKKREEVALSLMWEIGKTWNDSLAEFDRTIQYLKETIDFIEKISCHEQALYKGGWGVAQLRRLPRGICLLVGPFNYPLNESFSIMWPGLLAGNCFIVKQPRWGALSWAPLLEDLKACFPAGVIQVLSGKGSEILPVLLGSGEIQSLSFVGSSSTAMKLLSLHPYSFQLHRLLGLDAKNAAVFDEDVSLKNYLSTLLKGAFSFNGQRCTALKIAYIHEKNRDEFEKMAKEAIEKISCRYPWEKDAFVTPLVDPMGANRCHDWIEQAEISGASILKKGKIHQGGFLDPSLVTNVQPGMRLFEEEQFGPVLPVRYYSSLDEVQKEIVQSPFGMQISLFSDSASWLQKAGRLFEHLVCRVNFNSAAQRSPDQFPFAGRKASSYGSLGLQRVYEELTFDSVAVCAQSHLAYEIFQKGGTQSFHLENPFL
jgi:acyl-CoA reductase-like NAD-dependent aldehyde dehydrogenase